MNKLAAGLIVAWLGMTRLAVNPCVAQTTGAVAAVPDLSDATEKQYQALLADDDAAQAEVDQWIRDEQAFAAKGTGLPSGELSKRIRRRFDPIRQAYDQFLKTHPDHARARIAYGSFLNDIQDDKGAEQQWEQARALDPKNPAVWNNLANHYTHAGSLRKAFEYYAKAIELNPAEPVYYHNFGSTVYLFRKDAMEIYQLSQPQVLDKALQLYAKALKLDPTNFPLASDLAQTYYPYCRLEPARTDEGLRAWTNALAIARDHIEREGVYLHFARLKLAAERFAEARADLQNVTNPMYTDLKKRLARNLDEQERQAGRTNSPPETGARK